jgi:hypothetical protein
MILYLIDRLKLIASMDKVTIFMIDCKYTNEPHRFHLWDGELRGI